MGLAADVAALKAGAAELSSDLLVLGCWNLLLLLL